MNSFIKFGGQMSQKNFGALRALAFQTGKKLSTILDEAAGFYLKANQIRPEFRKAMEASLKQQDKLYKKLAQ